MRVSINFGSHTVEAEATKLRRVRPTWYATGEHFGMNITEEQRVGSPLFDPDSPITWETTNHVE